MNFCVRLEQLPIVPGLENPFQTRWEKNERKKNSILLSIFLTRFALIFVAFYSYKISEEADDQPSVKEPLTTAEFVEWSCAQFAQPVTFENENETASDVESRAHHERAWRCLRNKKQRREAREEQHKAIHSRIESQIFHTRTPQPPDVLAFHPFDPHIAVAAKDSFGVWDWHTGAKLTYCTSRGTRPSRVTALEFVNAHDVSFLMAASDDGAVRIWKNYCSMIGRDPTLLTAWQALADVQPAPKGSTGNYSNY